MIDSSLGSITGKTSDRSTTNISLSHLHILAFTYTLYDKFAMCWCNMPTKFVKQIIHCFKKIKNIASISFGLFKALYAFQNETDTHHGARCFICTFFKYIYRLYGIMIFLHAWYTNCVDTSKFPTAQQNRVDYVNTSGSVGVGEKLSSQNMQNFILLCLYKSYNLPIGFMLAIYPYSSGLLAWQEANASTPWK